ncbi:MAG: aspartyl protease family protein [Isosphaeraceae bacterium]
MIATWIGLALLTIPIADDPPRKPAADAGKTYRVPYRNTDTNHALVRVRINGKGPFNFLVDTGAPFLFVGTEAAEKAGLVADKDSYYTAVDRLEFEGGPSLTGLKARIEDPFQLVGMNALGLPGASIDGILGYAILARFRFTLDPTDDRMTWTRLDFDPEDLEVPADPKERNAPADVQAMNMMGPLMKFASILIGKKPETQLRPRGWLGIELESSKEGGPPKVARVVDGSPAATAGLKAGDVIERAGDRETPDAKALFEATRQFEAGAEVALKIRRGGESRVILLTAGEGL